MKFVMRMAAVLLATLVFVGCRQEKALPDPASPPMPEVRTGADPKKP